MFGCEVWGCSISRESWGRIEKIQKQFITSNLKIKRNIPYPILLLEVDRSPIEMARYTMYKHKLNNMGDQRLPKTALKSSQDQLRLKRGWYKDATTWLNHWGIDENSTLQDINNIKIIITSKFKEKMWDKKVLEGKRKLWYYKELINLNLEVQNYLCVITSSKRKLT